MLLTCEVGKKGILLGLEECQLEVFCGGVCDGVEETMQIGHAEAI